MRRERRLSFSLSCRLHAKRGIRSRARARAHSAHSDTRPETMAHTSACMASQTIYVHVHVNAVPTDRFRFSFNAVRVFSHFVHRILYLHLRARGGGGGSQSACPQYAYLARRTVRVRCTVHACGCKSGCIHMVGSALTWHQNKTTPPNLHFRGRQCTDFVVTAYTSRVGMTTPWASRLACASSSKARSDLAAVTAAKKSLAVSVYHFANTRVRQNVAGPCVLVWMRSQSS